MHHNHCHYERHREESVGPLTRTTLSHTTDCHLHDPTTPCPGSRDALMYRGDLPAQQHHCRTPDGDNRSALADTIQQILNTCSTDSDVRRLVNDAVQQSDRDNERLALMDAIERLLQQSDEDRHGRRPSHNCPNDIEIDVLLNFDPIPTNTSRHSVVRPRRARNLSRRDLLNILTGNTQPRNIGPMPLSAWAANGVGLGMTVPITFDNGYGRDWLRRSSGIWH
jgi:hypothetical protein